MATSLSEIYDVFLSKISDYSFLSPDVTAQEIDEELFGYFKSAKTKFHKCKNSLNTRMNELGEQEVESDLTDYEIEVIAKLMIVEYMTPQILSTEVIKQSLSDKDFKIYSQANQLRELKELYKLLQKEARKMITEYSYLGMTDDVGE